MGRKDGKKMMFITFTDEELLTKCFSEWAYDRDAIDWGNQDREAQVRCAIVGFTHYVRRFLIDYYNVDIKEEGEI